MKNNKGFTLLETVISMAIISMVAIPFLTLFVQSSQIQHKAGNISKAAAIAQNILENVRSNSYGGILGYNSEAREQYEDYYVQIQVREYERSDKRALVYVIVKVYDAPEGGHLLAVRQTLINLHK